MPCVEFGRRDDAIRHTAARHDVALIIVNSSPGEASRSRCNRCNCFG